MTTVTGGSGNDNLNGGNGDDTINGNGGNDTADGKSGDDTINGGTGNDNLDGGSGDDTIDGGADHDDIDGGSGDDTLTGGSGDDDIDGGSGDDEIHGGSGEDDINGGSGDDDLFGDEDDDFINGHSGNDDIFGGGGADILRGFTGNDHLHGNAGNDQIDGGTGFDTAYYDANIEEFTFQRVGASLIVTHLGGAGSEGQDTLVNVERLVFNNRVINVGSGNNAPIAVDDMATTGEDSAGVSGNVLTNDFDFEGGPLSVTPGTFVGTYGTLTLNSNGSYTYVLNANAQTLDQGETGQDNFNYTVSDGSLSDTGKLTINVNGANDAPVANDDTAATTEDASVSGNVLANDTDVDVEALTVTNPGVYVGAYGTLTLAADGSYTYAPGAAAQALDVGESAQDVFSYTASDGTASDSATLTVTVNGANDAPVANDDVASTNEDSAGVSGNVLANDTDVDGEPLTVANPGVYVGAYGTLTLNADGSYTYVPGAAAQGLDVGESASDVFSYTASDGTASDSATLTVTVNGANDAPVANDDVAATSEDGTASGNVLANDTDVDGEALTVSDPGTYTGSYGTLVLAADGSYTYTPNAAAQGLDTGETANDVFSYTASDGTAADTATLTVTVTGANDAPVANDDVATTDEDSAVSGNVLANDTDVDGEALTVSNPGTYVGTYGTLTLNADGSYTYAPGAAAQALNAGDVVNDVFSYTASDGTASDSATLTITVTGSDDAAGPPWYIDNNAVGSTNVGSAANPFTSIAAFNAAQGSPNGPAAGDQVYLLSGVYAEADGINLLDGQILTGLGDPLIAPTAGDGVNVGLDNSISGIGIISGANAGIADSGGSVGALNVSGVFINTTGGVGIDLDAGGANVSITNTSISSSANYAILGANVAGFTLTDSSASSGASSSGTISLTDLTGTADFLGNILNGGGGDTLSIVNGGGSLTLNIADSAFNEAVVGPNDDVTGDDGVSITTNGGTLTLTVDGVDFQGARDDLLEVNALGSSTQSLTISNNSFHNGQASAGGGGVELNGGGAGSDIAVDYQVVGNSIIGVSGSAFSGAYTQQSGTVRGYIAGNVIGIVDGVGGSDGSAGGDGISASLQKSAGPGDATYLVTIFDNDIYDVNGGSGIALRASGGTATDSAVMEATVLDNVVDEHGDFAFAGLYALVGGLGGGDFSELGLVLDGNTIDAGEADFGLDAVYLDQASANAHFYVPGYSGSANGEFATPPGTASVDLTAFWGANNTLVPTPFSFFGGVDAGFVTGLTGEPLTEPAYFP
ncbi:MAG TPA: Ig-like domain-containing protein [Allosphingosinicella sp.]|nr:Ig-like domain-containing protein [Allosphingosinicella sp.]